MIYAGESKIALLLAMGALALGDAKASLSPASYSYFLPAEIRDAAIAEIAKYDFSETTLSARENALFTSEESITSKAETVRNRVQYFPGQRFDLWFMSQSKTGGPADFSQWNKLMIIVDKTANPPKSYYLEFGEEPIAARTLPTPRAFTAACYTCHASGPRVIRTQPALATPISPKNEALIAKWNQEIAAYKRVATYFPNESPHISSPPIRRTFALQNQEFQHKACTECHNPTDGMRAPLKRQHHYSILALASAGHMPVDGPKLAKRELKCIEAWLKGPEALKKAKNCNEYGEAKNLL